MDILPRECHYNIATFLVQRDLHRVVLVSKAYYGFFVASNLKQVEFRACRTRNLGRKLDAFLTNTNKNYEHIRKATIVLQWRYSDTSTYIDQYAIIKAIQAIIHMTNLQGLTLDFGYMRTIEDEEFCEVLKTVPKWNKLKNLNVFLAENAMNAAVRHCNIETLEAVYIGIQDQGASYSTLKSLYDSPHLRLRLRRLGLAFNMTSPYDSFPDMVDFILRAIKDFQNLSRLIFDIVDAGYKPKLFKQHINEFSYIVTLPRHVPTFTSSSSITMMWLLTGVMKAIIAMPLPETEALTAEWKPLPLVTAARTLNITLWHDPYYLKTDMRVPKTTMKFPHILMKMISMIGVDIQCKHGKLRLREKHTQTLPNIGFAFNTISIPSDLKMRRSGIPFGCPVQWGWWLNRDYQKRQSAHSEAKAKALVLIEEGRAAAANFREFAGSVHVADGQANEMLGAIADRIMEIVDQLCANVSKMDFELSRVAALSNQVQDLIDEDNVGAENEDAWWAFHYGLETYMHTIDEFWPLKAALETWIFEGDVMMAGQMEQE
ncbi:hypothetical protein LZL87_014056 [Fusarium oxysporum]|nr:hypothetical protein LZL87_014056 [Fusarium oxysporum]